MNGEERMTCSITTACWFIFSFYAFVSCLCFVIELWAIQNKKETQVVK